ncbi:MAG: Sb-PDE family phosphodiesterase [Bacteroidota bacterium]
MKNTLFLAFILLNTNLLAQHKHTRVGTFPNVGEYLTLKVDLHIHTIFSDGSVWPDIRVQEAQRDSLDLVSMTEHLEYQPHEEDIPHPDRNRSYELTSQLAKPYRLMVANGAEITRSMPPGHNNAIFIQDANKLKVDDPLEAFKEANRQGAFVFWNHPNWIAQNEDGIAQMTDMHQQLIEEGLLHGIEVVNDLTYSDEALQLALDYDLTIMGTSDVHGLVDWQYGIEHGGHRPITLVFAEEKTQESIKEALMARRTVAWFRDLLIGRDSFLSPLIEASLEVEKVGYQGISSVVDVYIRNNSSVNYILANQSPYTLHANGDVFVLKANETTKIEVKTLKQLEELVLDFEVLNGIVAPKKHPMIKLKIVVPE